MLVCCFRYNSCGNRTYCMNPGNQRSMYMCFNGGQPSHENIKIMILNNYINTEFLKQLYPTNIKMD